MEKNLIDLDEKLNKLAISNKIGFCYDDRMLLHKDYQNYHPEKPERIMSIYSNLIKKNLINKLIRIQPEDITDKELELVYHEKFINSIVDLEYEEINGKKVKREENKNDCFFSLDTYDNKYTNSSARVSAGSLLTCCKSVIKGDVKHAFAIIRPPGHHANKSKCRGFCFYNNVAISVEYLKGLNKRVAIVDWDVHHGDGTQEIFYENNNPLFISIHRHDNGLFYPCKTGKVSEKGIYEGKGYNINIPWNTEIYDGEKSFIGDDEYFYAFEKIVIPILNEYKPDIIIISCGFDAAEGDELGGMALSPIGYSYMTQKLKGISENLIYALEGGYNLNSLARCSEAIIRTLLDEENPFSNILLKKEINDLNLSLNKIENDFFRPCNRIINYINEIKNEFKNEWSILNNISTIKPRINKEYKEDDKTVISKILKVNQIINKYLITENENSSLNYIKFKIGRTKNINDIQKINIENRTTTAELGYRINGLKFNDKNLKSHNLYNWNGKDGCFNVNKGSINTIFMKYLNYYNLKEDYVIKRLRTLISDMSTYSKMDFNGLNLFIYFNCIDGIKSDNKIILKINGLNKKTVIDSKGTKFKNGIENIIKYF